MWNCSCDCVLCRGVQQRVLATAVLVVFIHKLFDSFNSVKHAAPGKAFRSPLSDNSPHIEHWTKASMAIKSWIFLKCGKPALKQLTPSENGRITNNGTVQHVWRTLRSAGFDYLETRSLNQDHLENTFGVILLHCGAVCRCPEDQYHQWPCIYRSA